MEGEPKSPQRPEDAKPTTEEMRTHLEYYRTHRDEYIEQAAKAREQAISHRAERPFKVGCVVLMWIPSGVGREGEYKVFEGHNIRPHDIPVEPIDKRCAERNAIDKGRSFHPWPVIIASVSISRETNVSRVARGTDIDNADDALHPCPECRDMLRDLYDYGLLLPESIMCNINDSQKLEDGKPKVIEERTAEELLFNVYKEDIE